MHLPDPGQDWGECAYKRHKTRKHYGLAAMAFVKAPGILEITWIEKTRLLALENPRAETPAERIAEIVTEHGGNKTSGDQRADG